MGFPLQHEQVDLGGYRPMPAPVKPILRWGFWRILSVQDDPGLVLNFPSHCYAWQGQVPQADSPPSVEPSVGISKHVQALAAPSPGNWPTACFCK